MASGFARLGHNGLRGGRRPVWLRDEADLLAERHPWTRRRLPQPVLHLLRTDNGFRRLQNIQNSKTDSHESSSRATLNRIT